MKDRYFFDQRLCVKTGDITAETTDAIVNAANKTLLGGGGVDGAIHRAGGPEILLECRKIRKERFPKGLPTGEAVITTGGRLAVAHVIHTVGPVYNGGDDNENLLLSLCYQNCISLAENKFLRSISFPSISTGAFGFPKRLAAGIASRTIAKAIDELRYLRLINLVFFTEDDARTFISNSVFV